MSLSSHRQLEIEDWSSKESSSWEIKILESPGWMEMETKGDNEIS